MVSYSVKSIRIVSGTFRHAALTHCSLPTLKHQRNLYLHPHYPRPPARTAGDNRNGSCCGCRLTTACRTLPLLTRSPLMAFRPGEARTTEGNTQPCSSRWGPWGARSQAQGTAEADNPARSATAHDDAQAANETFHGGTSWESRGGSGAGAQLQA